MNTRKLDTEGRVNLGSQFAKQTGVMDDSNPACILIKPVVMIPAMEAWLYKNEEALGLVREGLEDARSGNFAAKSPGVENANGV